LEKLILGKLLKLLPPNILKQKCIKLDFGWGCPQTQMGELELTALLRPLAGFNVASL